MADRSRLATVEKFTTLSRLPSDLHLGTSQPIDVHTLESVRRDGKCGLPLRSCRNDFVVHENAPSRALTLCVPCRSFGEPTRDASNSHKGLSRLARGLRDRMIHARMQGEQLIAGWRHPCVSPLPCIAYQDLPHESSPSANDE